MALVAIEFLTLLKKMFYKLYNFNNIEDICVMSILKNCLAT